MREIKFRAWRRTEKELIYDALQIRNIGLGDGSVIADERVQQGDELDWMQYTGLKDRNGKEIYEGDIVQSIDWGQPKRARAMVIFEGYEWKTVPKNRGSHKTAYDLWSQVWGKEGEFVEVIGNIHENPELLEEDSE